MSSTTLLPRESTAPAFAGNATNCVLAIPILANGAPDWTHRTTGVVVRASSTHVELELETDGLLSGMSLMLVGQSPKIANRCAGIVIQRNDAGHVEAIWGGIADELLRDERITPRFNPATMDFTLGFPVPVLDEWARIGVLRSQVIDRVQVCPNCKSLPTFRAGCGNCGSIQLRQVRFIHHFGCAHVGPVAEFESSSDLTCPKCRTRRLVPGSDFEYLAGPVECRDCRWTDTRSATVGQCLRCNLRFPGEHAIEIDLVGYHAERLDSLVFEPQS